MSKSSFTSILPAALMAALAFFTVSCDLFGPPAPTEDPADTGLSSGAYLSSLSVSASSGPVALTPVFDKEAGGFSGKVGRSITQVTIAATAADASATLEGEGVVTLGDYGSVTDAALTVTAEDGVTKRTYTVSITRARLDESDDASLASIAVEDGESSPAPLSPAFDPGILEYGLEDLPYGYGVYWISASAADAAASVSATGPWALAEGSNSREIVVVAQDGVTTRTYTLRAVMLAPEGSRLSILELSPLALEFDPKLEGYELAASTGTASVTLSLTPEFPTAIVEYSLDAWATRSVYTAPVEIPLGTAGGAPVVLEILSTSEYGTFTSAHTVTIKRAAAGASNDPSLTSLSVGSYGSPLALTPPFDPEETNYTASVASNYGYISSIDATPANAGAIVAHPALSLELQYGETNVDITVTAADGVATRTYSVLVTRPLPPTVEVTSPAAGAIVTSASMSVAGSFVDPNGEIDSIYVGFNPFGYDLEGMIPAEIVGSAFSATLDLGGMTKGPKSFVVRALDGDGSTVCSAYLDFTLDVEGAPLGHALTIPMDVLLPLDGPRDLYVIIYDMDTGTYGPMSMGTPVAAADFPLSFSLVGVPDGHWMVQAVLTMPGRDEATHMNNIYRNVAAEVSGADAIYPEMVYLFGGTEF
ncbi:MAG: cadherin-like beta sandwich domain-containing protein [Spirochaetales bacterium]|nr:cadherin-like beta sandwich domain-containing protein [Spirochaetales bacterium]